MSTFFSTAGPAKEVTHGSATFELPILYFRDDAFGLFYTADPQKVKNLLPSDKLHPILLPGNRTIVGVAAFNYIDTTIGSYGEIGLVIPVVHSNKVPRILLPLLLESRYPGFGVLVMHLPVTKSIARDAGRGQWGYTKFVADMTFMITPEFMECRMKEAEREILTMRVARKGIPVRDKKPLITYSVLNGNLIKTIIPQTGSFRLSVSPQDSFLKLGNHPVAESFGNLGLGRSPLLSRCYLERNAILPAGEIIETDVRPLDGYVGEDREEIHEIRYTEAIE
ncbi:MAG: acetoacetate decarboxylase family protein [Deltaproteobacteria bacterium]|nr:acetoacetate decarboxylase family protein [Deltaproteobacteria bacterium]MBW2218036.1 acetoacetate decarboxylase family protein [Deltaproteobacteria bacterium]